LNRLEFRNSIRRPVFTKQITSSEARQLLRLAEEDLREQTLLFHTPLEWTDILKRAEELTQGRFQAPD
jgi:hypothetical protein